MDIVKEGPQKVSDAQMIKDMAEAEIREERFKKAKNQVLKKMREIEDAKLIVRNLERELEDIYATLEQ